MQSNPQKRSVEAQMRGRKGIIILLLTGLMGLHGCGSSSSDLVKTPDTEAESASKSEQEEESEPGLVFESRMELQYAENFTVDYYEGGYVLLTTAPDGRKFLIVPENKEIPENLEEGTVTLRQPVKDLYLVASSAMDLFRALDGLDSIAFSGQKEDGWYIEEAREAMEQGAMVYAGKYSKPDYELIVSGGCTLAIENMMISHSPEVTEKLEEFGIPVMIEYSSYEPHPLGRVEWIKFYGALLDKEEEAERIFEEQTVIFERVAADEKTDKTVAFFFVTANGMIQVRQSSDYIPKMIEFAGGKYIFENLGDEETRRSTINIQVEEFYAGAKDADFLIYNRIGKKPVLAIEVDGYEYHKEGTAQASRDRLKNHIMELYEIPLLRFKTNGSGEREKITEMLDKLVG